MEKSTSVEMLKSSAFTKEAQAAIKARLESTADVKIPLTKEDAVKALNEVYKEASALTLPFGETVADIMRIQGITKKRGGKIILDVPRAVKLTHLSEGIFRTNMWKNDCVVDMALVVTMAIGFKLSDFLTDRLLQSAGLAFRFDNPDHLAYMFLLEYCKDLDIDECNKILDGLGVRKTRQLGSRPRGKDGQFEGYNKPEK